LGKDWLSFEDAKALVQRSEILTMREYKNKKEWRKKYNLPSNSNAVYADQGWAGWDDFLGKVRSRTLGIKWPSLEEAKAIIRREAPALEITSAKKYQEAKAWREKYNLPSNAERIYAMHGWVSWPDFLGKDTPKKRYLRRRNPDDLERLEKIAKARKIYQETRSLNETGRQVGVRWDMVKSWVEDLIIPAMSYQEWEDKKLKAKELCRTTRLEHAEIANRLGVVRATVTKWCKGIIRPENPRMLKARELYQTTLLSVQEIADQVGMAKPTINTWCKNLTRPKNPVKLQAQELCRTTMLSHNEIAKITGAKRRNVAYWCQEILRPKKEHPLKSKAQELCRNTTLTQREIAQNIDMSEQVVGKWCKGIREKRDFVALKLKAQELCRSSSMTRQEIADELNVSYAAVLKWCREP